MAFGEVDRCVGKEKIPGNNKLLPEELCSKVRYLNHTLKTTNTKANENENIWKS